MLNTLLQKTESKIPMQSGKRKVTHSIVIALAFASLSNAQTNNLQRGAEVSVPVERFNSQTPSPERTQTSEWYNYGQAIYDLGGSVSYFRNYLFPDSTVVFEGSTGMAVVWKHSLGQVLDPTSFNFFNNTTLTSAMDYTLDSVRLWYRYFRFQSGAPDTLVIQIYKDNHITFAADPWGTGVPYARCAYNYTARKGMNADYEFTILLSDADTAMGVQRTIDIPLNIYVAPGDKIAATITYFPGNPFNAGDTIDAYMASPPVNLINAFVVYDFRDNDKLNDPLIYNNELNATKEVRYNISTNGWNGKYIPGTAWNSGFYHLDMDFKVTTEPVSVAELATGNSSMIIYPNPATTEFRIHPGVSGRIESVEVYNALGEKCLTPTLSKGEGVRVEVSSLPRGIYFVKVRGGKSFAAGKFVKE